MWKTPYSHHSHLKYLSKLALILCQSRHFQKNCWGFLALPSNTTSFTQKKRHQINQLTHLVAWLSVDFQWKLQINTYISTHTYLIHTYICVIISPLYPWVPHLCIQPITDQKYLGKNSTKLQKPSLEFATQQVLCRLHMNEAPCTHCIRYYK